MRLSNSSRVDTSVQDQGGKQHTFCYELHKVKVDLVQWDACGTPTVKIRFGCTQNCKASQQDCVKSLSIISSSKPTNQIVQNLYRFLIDLLPLKNVSERSLPKFSHSWFVNQRNPSGYWQVTKGDLSKIISSLHDSFLFRSSFFIRFQQRLVAGRDF